MNVVTRCSFRSELQSYSADQENSYGVWWVGVNVSDKQVPPNCWYLGPHTKLHVVTS